MKWWTELWPQVLAVSFLAGVLGNLAASLLWATPALVHLHRKLDRQHGERLAQAERHHNALMGAVGHLREGHVRTVEAINTTLGGGP